MDTFTALADPVRRRLLQRLAGGPARVVDLAADDVPPALWDIGIRVEDNVLVTAAGCETLTTAAPRTIGEIEALMAQRG